MQAQIVFPPTGDRPGRNSVASVMVSGASCLVTYDLVSTTKIIRRALAGLVSAHLRKSARLGTCQLLSLLY